MKGDRGEHHSIAAALGRPSVTILRTSTFSRGSDRADLTSDEGRGEHAGAVTVRVVGSVRVRVLLRVRV